MAEVAAKAVADAKVRRSGGQDTPNVDGGAVSEAAAKGIAEAKARKVIFAKAFDDGDVSNTVVHENVADLLLNLTETIISAVAQIEVKA